MTFRRSILALTVTVVATATFPFLAGCGSTPTIVQPPVGPAYAVAFNPTTNLVYTGDISGNVSVLDGTTYAVLGTIPVGGTPYAIAVNPKTNTAFVANFISDSVSIIDGATRTLTATVPLASGSNNPLEITLNDVTNKVYVLQSPDSGPGVLSVIDGSTHQITAEQVMAGASSVAVNSTTNEVYVANAQELEAINGATGVVSTTITYPTPFTTPMHAPALPVIAVNETTDTIYVSGGFGTDTVYVINGQQGQIAATLSVPQLGGSIAVDPAANLVYLASGNATGYGVAIINGSTNTLGGGIAFAVSAVNTGGDTAASLAVNAAAHLLYVAESSVGFEAVATPPSTTSTVN